MKWKLLASLMAVVVVETYAVPPSDACGVKLMLKQSRPRKTAARSSNPSHLLLVGAPPRRLEHDLTAAGHDVEVVSSTNAAKRPSYAIVVVASNDQVAEAHAKFGNSIVMVRSDDISSDLRSVENQIARKPVQVLAARAPLAAGPNRQPLGTSVVPKKEIVAIKEPDETPTTPDPVPAKPAPPVKQPAPVVKVTTAVPKVEETAPPAPVAHKLPVHDAVVASASAALHNELYFTLGSASIGNKAALAKSVRFLTDNGDAHVVVAGYADPSGTAEANMALSQSRAESVRDFLVAAGVDVSRIEVAAFGDTQLKYGRADGRNRRVTIEAKK